MPDGAESHVLKGWLFDRLTRHVALGEALIDIELSHQNSVALLTYGPAKASTTVVSASEGLTLRFLTTILGVFGGDGGRFGDGGR